MTYTSQTGKVSSVVAFEVVLPCTKESLTSYQIYPCKFELKIVNSYWNCDFGFRLFSTISTCYFKPRLLFWNGRVGRRQRSLRRQFIDLALHFSFFLPLLKLYILFNILKVIRTNKIPFYYKDFTRFFTSIQMIIVIYIDNKLLLLKFLLFQISIFCIFHFLNVFY